MKPTGEVRRYPCPECVRPPKYQDRDSRNGYSLIRANKVVNERYAKDERYMDSQRGNLCALIGRTLYTNGLVKLEQYRAPPNIQGTDNVVIEGIVETRWPDGDEADRVIQDLDPDAYFGEGIYRPDRQRRRDLALLNVPPPSDGPDIRMMIGSDPALTPTPKPSKPTRPKPPRTNRELIFDDPPDDEG